MEVKVWAIFVVSTVNLLGGLLIIGGRYDLDLLSDVLFSALRYCLTLQLPFIAKDRGKRSYKSLLVVSKKPSTLLRDKRAASCWSR